MHKVGPMVALRSTPFVGILCLALVLLVRGALAQGIVSHDWTRFNWDAGRSGNATASTGINPTNVASLERQQVHIDGTVDASAIYLQGIGVNGASHDVFFV